MHPFLKNPENETSLCITYRVAAANTICPLLLQLTDNTKRPTFKTNYSYYISRPDLWLTVVNKYPANEENKTLFINCRIEAQQFIFPGYIENDNTVAFDDIHFPYDLDSTLFIITVFSSAMFFAIAHKKEKLKISYLHKRTTIDVIDDVIDESFYNNIKLGFENLGMRISETNKTNEIETITNFECFVNENSIRNLFNVV